MHPYAPDADATEEGHKRRKELGTGLILIVLLLVLVSVEYRLFGMSQQLPFAHSIFFLGLVNFNIILFLLLFFLIFRNVVKIFAERQSGLAGGTLRAKLIAAFVLFSFVPTALMFIVSVFYINNSFDKWFSETMAGVLKSSLEISKTYSLSTKYKNYALAERVAAQVARMPRVNWAERLGDVRQRFDLDVVEYYPSVFGDRVISVNPEKAIPKNVPPVSLEMLNSGIKERDQASSTQQFLEGDLVRIIHPVEAGKERGAIVVSTFIPLALTAKTDDIAAALEDFRDVNPLEFPIKTIYLIILVLMTLTIMLGATWFGFYLARQLSVPLVELGTAAMRVANRDYRRLELTSGSREINELVRHFNQMTGTLERSEREVREANANLREHSRYVNVVLSTVSTGVVSLDADDVITVLNRHAAKLLEAAPEDIVGRRIQDVLAKPYVETLDQMTQSMRTHQTESITREMQIHVGERTIPLQMTLSFLTDDRDVEIGKVLVFDDLTPVLNAQRAAAWTEVARRIAHEIKNPLTPIKLSAERLQKKFGPGIQDEAFRECTRSIIEQVDSLKNLVNEFNQFARLPKSSPVRGDLNLVIDAALGIFRNAGRAGAIHFGPRADLPMIEFDPDQVQRIINNLLDNALGAVEGRPEPKIVIRTFYDTVLKIARIEVEDNGPGISAALRERVFEPYVTTKEHGTGLGLALVKRMVEDHHGYIRVLSDGRTHTRFVIELPGERA